MPLFLDGKRVKAIKHGTDDVSYVFSTFGTQKVRVWSQKLDFTTTSWTEIGQLIADGSWVNQKWELGNEHQLKFKDGTVGRVRIIGINDGREDTPRVDEDGNIIPWMYQVDKNGAGEKAHLTLELTALLPKTRRMYSTQASDSEPQTWSQSLLYKAMQPGGDIYENLPNDFQKIIFPVQKSSGISGNLPSADPDISTNYLFIPSLTEYLPPSDYEYAVNSQEGGQYQFYANAPDQIPKKLIGSSDNRNYYTRSASSYDKTLYNYFWTIGSQSSFGVTISSQMSGVTFACCL